VSFLNGTTALNGCTNVAISGTTASCVAAFTQSKTYSINASYSNDPNFADSNTSLSYQVDKPEPGMRASGTVLGSSTILDVTLTGGLGKPTGKVVIKLGTRTLCGATVIRAVASCHVPSTDLKAGRHRLAIRYGGSSSYASLASDIVVSVR
jgi:Big-like domain-containing protein